MSTSRARRTCPACDAPLRQGARFCDQCGTDVSTIECVQCHAPLRAGAKFCDNCGTRVGATAAAADAPARESADAGAVHPPHPEADANTPEPQADRWVGAPASQRWLLVVGSSMLLVLVLAGSGLAYVSAQRWNPAAVRQGTTGQLQSSATGVVVVPNLPATTPGPVRSGPTEDSAALAAVNGHWEAIKGKDFATAYGYLAPDSTVSADAWIASHQQAGVHDVTHIFSVREISGDAATLDITALQTRAHGDETSSNPSGCLNWSGSYAMKKQSGRWLISRAQISPAPC